MKSAIGYIRISTKDQSNFSLDGQKEYISDFCEREQIQLLETFKDDGFSAKNFDRPSWKDLKLFIKKHHKQIDYLVVCKYDRFSRNTAEGLNMIEELEKKFKIIILSVFERILIDPSSPYFFKQRADMLVAAEFELHVIRERTKFGLHQSAKSGRHPFRAPWGYKNARDDKNKPILIKDESKQHIIKFIFESFMMGMPQKEIAKKAREMGLTKTGRSSIQRILTCPIYAGLVKVQSFKDEKERLSDGIHSPMVPKHYYYEAIKLLGMGNGPRTILMEELPLRGLLRCSCGKEFTGGKSKGRSAYYWYYRCKHHSGDNHSAKKVHEKFDQMLKLMSLQETQLQYLKETFEKKFSEKMKEKGARLQSIRRKLSELRHKMESLEDKFISDQITREVYERWHRNLAPEYQTYLAEESRLQQSDKVYYDRFQAQLPALGDIHYVYNAAELPEKRELVKLWFKRSLTWVNTYFETTYIMPTFSHNLKKMSELHILELKKLKVISGKFPLVALPGAQSNPFDDLLIIFERINAA